MTLVVEGSHGMFIEGQYGARWPLHEGGIKEDDEELYWNVLRRHFSAKYMT